MWNGSNPPQPPIGMYSTTPTPNDTELAPLLLPHRSSNKNSNSASASASISSHNRTLGSTSASSAVMMNHRIQDDQLQMDAVSALTSLHGFASQIPPQNPTTMTQQLLQHPLSSHHNNSNNNSNQLQRHFSSEDAYSTTPSFLSNNNKPDDHMGSGLFATHPFHSHTSMYNPTSSLNGSGHSSSLPAVLLPSHPYVQQLVPTIPNTNTRTPPSRQGSSSSSMMMMTNLNHPERSQFAVGEMSTAASTSSSSATTAVYHPLHPNERLKMTTMNTTNPRIDIYHPPHPSERELVDIKSEEPIEYEDSDDDDEEEEDDDDDEMNTLNPLTGNEDEERHGEDNGDGNNEMEAKAEIIEKIEPKPRGKPEAAARALAAAKLEESRMHAAASLDDDDDDDDDDDNNEEEVDAKNAAPVMDPPKKATVARGGNSTKPPPPKKGATNRKKNTVTTNGPVPAVTSSSSVLISTATTLSSDPVPVSKREFLLGEEAPTISEAEYKNLQDMMIQFCRVPLLSEFSRPVAMLHPEVAPLYSKIITHPVDLGHVCRGIRRRQYSNCRDVRLDVWRVFANCVKYNAHPTNKEAVPSFVSIALHLRDYFNNLWQEYLLPSDPPRKPKALNNTKEDIAVYEVAKAAFAKRNEERKKRLENSGVLVLSKTFTVKASRLLLDFIENGGRVDKLDKEALFGKTGANEKEVDLVIQRLKQYHAQLEDISESGSIEYTLDAFYKDLTKCYTEHVDVDNLALQNRFRCRLDRFFWKQAVPLHEANSRGVTQSSIWGNLAATIWARESSKKAFWPALCLGILPPAEQREGWHQAVTERNESRLPEKLRSQLMVAKKRCEQAQKRQSLSYFLVEFLGTHEFIWVRETDIIENFDPNTDPNKTIAGKKSRSTSSVVGSKTYATAIQECVWASEEYENVLQDAFENTAASEHEEDDDEINVSFMTLAQSDDELDQGDEYGYSNDNDNMDWSDVEESNYLISNDGMFDASMAGRKTSKKRSQSLKKPMTKKITGKDVVLIANKDDPNKKKRSRPKGKSDALSTEVANVAANASDDGRAVKNDTRDLERRRKKRLRDHEKSIKADARKKVVKRRRTSSEDDELDQRLVSDKKYRATAIVNAYLMRLARQHDIKSLALSGVLTMPSASVDSNGLLGMALAFRAASGGLCMPDDGKEQLAKWKPWVIVDTERPKTAAERVRNLEKKIELVENEIRRLRNNTMRREQLTAQYISKRSAMELAAESDDVAARFNHYKKRKKLTTSKTENISDSESPVGKMSVVSVQEPLLDIETAESKEDMTTCATDNESDGDVMVDEQDQSAPDLDATAGEYDSSEAMDAVDSE